MDRYIRLSDKKHLSIGLNGAGVMNVHINELNKKGKVTFSTNIPIAEQPVLVYLCASSLGNQCYQCHVWRYDFRKAGEYFIPEDKSFQMYAPQQFADTEKTTWLIFDSIKRLPISQVDHMHPNNKLSDFLTSNNRSPQLII